MIGNLKVGAIFNGDYIALLSEINTKCKLNKISEVYGSIQLHEKYTARPGYRIPIISMEYLETYVAKLKELNIDFVYTLNTSNLGGKKELLTQTPELKKVIKDLLNIGIKKYIVTLPYVANIIRSVSEDASIYISTIAHIDTLTQIEVWNDLYRIEGVCVNLLKNRDIHFLKAASSFCSSKGIKLELIANEFCCNGDARKEKMYTTHCIFRDHCYQIHSIGYTQEEDNILKYPMSCCKASRSKKVSWLKANVIRPEDLYRYKEIGINSFKITGRTATFTYIKKVLLSYANESFEGNFLDLWFGFDNIRSEEECKTSYIDNKDLNVFLDYWFNGDVRCADEVCGQTCQYCDNFLDSL